MMSFDREDKQWKCVKGGAVNFQKVSSIVRDIGEPCLHQSPIKVVSAVRISILLFLLYAIQKSNVAFISNTFFSLLGYEDH